MRVEFLQLGRVDIHSNLVSFARQVLRSIAGDRHVEPSSKNEQKVAVLQCEVCTTGSDISRTPNESGHIRRNKIGRAPGGDRGNIEQETKLVELLFGASEARSVSREEQRTRRALQLYDDATHFVFEIGVCHGSFVL